ncbi:hypothetical protein [Merdibacter massiliensis]|uniref:hypothetical protein n=1 Tax=Merdibacter massiliensis TaxID=1871030 RepID=UPI00096A94E3|nr:hypothetical protein [Merdibacter massiliensis]
MNKQALAFLTLFSLILMLSVYYVTLPNDVTAVISENTEQAEEEKADTSQQDESTALQDSITKNINEQLNEANAVMADTDSSEEDKQAALQKIETLENVRDQQQKIQENLKKKEFTSVVEISDGTCRITLFDCEENKENVNTVMKEAYAVVNDNYLLEVTFKTS